MHPSSNLAIMKRSFAFILISLFAVACNNENRQQAPSSSVPDSQALTTVQDKQPATAADTLRELEGSWQLNYISGPRIAFDGLYPDNKPTISFDIAGARVSGNTGCNTFSGPVRVSEKSIGFGELATTRMACKGNGEAVFLAALRKVNRFDITDGNTLHLLQDDIALLRFTRSQ